MGLPSEDRVRADTSVIQDFPCLRYFTRGQMNIAAMVFFSRRDFGSAIFFFSPEVRGPPEDGLA